MCVVVTCFMLCANNRVSAQAPGWWLNPFGPYSHPRLQTLTYAPPGTPPSDVIINSSLAVNINETLLPYPTIAPGAPVEFPLVVNTIAYPFSGSITDYINIALTDTLTGGDSHIRSIAGLSSTGGVGIFSGNNDRTGSGIRLNAYNSGANPGAVQTLSYGASSTTTLAFEQVNYPTTGSTYNHLFQVSTSGQGMIGPNCALGDMQPNDIFTVTQELGFWAPSSSTPRIINGNAKSTELEVHAGTNYTDGASIELFGYNDVTIPHMNGGFYFTTDRQDCWSVFQNYVGVGLINSNMVVANNQVCIGNNVNPTISSSGDILEVLDQMGFYDGTDATPRTINGNTSGGELRLHANTNYQTGATSELFGSAYSTDPTVTGGFINTTTGGWTVFRKYVSGIGGGGSPYVFSNNMVIGNNQVTVGSNIDPSIAATGDVLTVKDQMGFFDNSPAMQRIINGNTSQSYLGINANTNTANGAGIQLMGGSYPLIGGFIMNTTNGAVGWDVFQNYNSGTVTTNAVIGNNQTTIGSGIDPSIAATGDVLTVKDQMGFYDADPTYPRTINGNATSAWLEINCGHAFGEAPSITLTGDVGLPYLSGGITNLSTGGWTTFENYNAGASFYNMVVGEDNQVTIGHGIDPTYAATGDVLTVKDQLGFYDGTDATPRVINGNTSAGDLAIHAKTGYANGATTELFGDGYLTNPHLQGGILNTTSNTGWAAFQNYNSGSPFYNMVIGNNQVTIGSGIDPTVAATGDVLTVKDQIGFYDADPAHIKTIHGNGFWGGLEIDANTASTDGGAIGMYSLANSLHPGQMFYYANSYPTTSGLTFAHTFSNRSSVGTINNLGITNEGTTIIGTNVLPAWASPGDVLTVQGQIGFYTPSPSAPRYLFANSNNGSLSLSMGFNGAPESHITLNGDYSSAGGIIDYISTMPSLGFGHVFNVNHSGASTPMMGISNNNNVTIGTGANSSWARPNDVLTVLNQMGFYAPSPTDWNTINGNSTSGALVLHTSTSSTNGPTFEMYGTSYPAVGSDVRAGSVRYISNGVIDAADDQLADLFMNTNSSAITYQMAITKGGRVVIGTDLITNLSTYAPSPNNYDLYVEKGILTERVHVAIHTTENWSDNVFDDDNDLMSLPKLEKYITKNKHLPEIPSAEQVVKDGVDVGEMDAKLLKKIEELTLYVIDLQKQVEELKAKKQ